MGRKLINGIIQYNNSANYESLDLIPKDYADNILTTAKAYIDTKIAGVLTTETFTSFYQYQIESLSGNIEVFTRPSREKSDACDILIRNYETSIDEYYGMGSNDADEVYGIVVKIGTTQLFKVVADKSSYTALSLTPYLPIVYRHSVSITGKISDTERYAFCFTIDHSKNTPIDSIQDLTTMLGNTTVTGSGANSTNTTFYQKLEIGASISNTLLYSLSSGTSLLLSSTTSIVIEDEVSAINFNAE